MKKSFVKIFSIVAMLILCGGCGKKEALTVNSFAAMLNDKDYDIVDLSEQYANSEIQNVVIAKNEDKYQIEFFILTNEENAKKLYNENVKNIQTSKYSGTKQLLKEGDNYNKYTLVTNNYSFIVSKVDNTLIYIAAPTDYQEEIETILEELDY